MSNPPSEADLSSHLTISPAPAPGLAATGSAAPAADDGQGFLSVLRREGRAATSATTEPGAALLPPRPTIDLDPQAGVAGQKPSALLQQLADRLNAIDDALDSGEQPDPDELEALATTLDTLAAMLLPSAAPAPAPVPPATPVSATTPLAATPTAPAIADLAAKLAGLGQNIAPLEPEIARQLDAFAQRLGAASRLSTPPPTAAAVLDGFTAALPGARPSPPDAPQSREPPTTPPAPAGSHARPARPALTAKAGDSADATPIDKMVTVTVTAATVDSRPEQPNPADAAPNAGPQPRVTPGSRATAADAAVQTPLATQVAFELVRQVHQGQSRFSIRIDPPELGRIEVKLHVDAAGNVNARLTVERAETLDMFQRDRGALERALGQAGLDGARTNLEFSLKHNPFAGMAGDGRRPGAGDDASTPAGNPAAGPVAPAAAIVLYRGVVSTGGVNLFV